MEERKLRSRLILIYVATVAVILAALLIALLFFSAHEIEQSSRETFSTLITAIGDELQNSDIVVYSKLNRLEQENRLMLSISDNGSSLLYNNPNKERIDLLAQVETTAAEEGFDVTSLPLTSERKTSPVNVYYAGGERYFGAVSILPMKTGYRTLTVVQRLDDPEDGRLVLYCAFYLVSVALLGCAGARLIDRALAPAVESRKRQKQFVAAASHELRSPLAVISANIASLPEEACGTAAAEIAQTECERMSRMIGDLLLLASADADNWTIKLKPVELDTLALDAYEAYLPLYKRNGAVLDVSIPEERPPQIRGDAERIKQVIGVLLDNALAYGTTDEHRSVELEVVCQRRHVGVHVIDHGPGLSREQKTRVFDRFYRADESRKEKQHFGLGLSIASELVRLNKGTLNVTDTPGGGCTFCIVFEL